jgi:hypothetical protein
MKRMQEDFLQVFRYDFTFDFVILYVVNVPHSQSGAVPMSSLSGAG